MVQKREARRTPIIELNVCQVHSRRNIEKILYCIRRLERGMTGNEQMDETCGPASPSCDACVMRAIRKKEREMSKPLDILEGYKREQEESGRNKAESMFESRNLWGALLDVLREPLKTFEQAFASRCAATESREAESGVYTWKPHKDSPWVHVPRPVAHAVQPKLLCDFCGRHGCGKRLCIRVISGSIGLPPGKSCLFAKTSSKHSFISLSLNIRWSSCFASSIRSRSCESTTNTRPCVPV